VTSIPVTEEASHHEVVEVTLAGIDQLPQSAHGEAPARHFQYTILELKVLPISMALQLVEDMPVAVAEVIGTGIEVEVHS
jgi:hypothetical protein